MSYIPSISVIVPVYKCEEYLESCVKSILNQTFTDFEIILVDDGSPDNCGKICDDLARKYNKITVLHQENQGQAAARNNGVKFARGEWLHFVDCDDIIHPRMLEVLYNAVTENNVKLAMCSAIQEEKANDDFYADKKTEFKTLEMNEDNILNLCKNENYYYWVVWGKIIHKSIYKKYPLTEGKIYEDNAIVCKWLHEAKVVAVTDTPLYFYYINTSGTTKKAFSEKNLDLLWSIREQLDFFYTLDYPKMLEYLCSYFFDSSFYLYNILKIANANDKLFSSITNDEIYVKRKYYEYVHLNYEQTLYYYKKTNILVFYLIRIKHKLGLVK